MAESVIVSVMPSSNAAYDLADAIKADQNEDFKIKTGAIVKKDDLGNVQYLEEKERPLWGTLGGTAVGALVGALAGPAGAAAGALLGASTGLVGDAVVTADDADFTDRVLSEMRPGSAALIMEADEHSTQYFDDMAQQFGGTVYR